MVSQHLHYSQLTPIYGLQYSLNAHFDHQGITITLPLIAFVKDLYYFASLPLIPIHFKALGRSDIVP